MSNKRNYSGYELGWSVGSLFLLALAIPVLVIITPAIIGFITLMCSSILFFVAGIALIGAALVVILCLIACCVR